MAKLPGGEPSIETKAQAGRSGRLLRWYDRVKRPLPWRRDKDPYRVWLSEVMLQQTRVATAIPYYERFLRAFPSVRALAGASDDEVRALWSGLGYYRRARMLHQAAQRVVDAGKFPRTAAQWRELPGVGSYTAAAVASICFGERVVALDGNLERVIARLEAFDGNPKSASGGRHLRAAGHHLLDAKRPGDSNQALMELGATICLPVQPRCEECPLASSCQARRSERVEHYPVRSGSEIKTRHQLIAVCVRNGSRLLLFRRRHDSKLLPGTWETPWVLAGEEDPESALGSRYGGTWVLGERIGSVRHSVTSRELSVDVHEGTLEASEVAESRPARWSDVADLEELPHSSLVRKIFRAARS